MSETANYYLERRRYGRRTFTWIYVRIDNKWHSAGDPYPKLNPSRQEIKDACQRAFKNYQLDLNKSEK